MALPQQTATLRSRASGRGAPRHQTTRAAAPSRTFSAGMVRVFRPAPLRGAAVVFHRHPGGTRCSLQHRRRRRWRHPSPRRRLPTAIHRRPRRRQPRRRRSPRPAAVATVASTDGGAGVRAERAANASVHTPARRGGTDGMHPHGGATRPWLAATPRLMHAIHTEEGAPPAAMQTTPRHLRGWGQRRRHPRLRWVVACRRRRLWGGGRVGGVGGGCGGGVGGGGRAAAAGLAGVRCPTVPPATFHKAAERRAAASTADASCRTGPRQQTHVGAYQNRRTVQRAG